MSQSAEWRLIDLDGGRCIAERVELAASWWNRLRGLIARKEFCAAQALVLRPCSAIHTIEMRFPIDVLFLDHRGTVQRVVEQVRPQRIGPIHWKSQIVIELPAGTVRRFGLAPGCRLALCRADGERVPWQDNSVTEPF